MCCPGLGSCQTDSRKQDELRYLRLMNTLATPLHKIEVLPQDLWRKRPRHHVDTHQPLPVPECWGWEIGELYQREVGASSH